MADYYGRSLSSLLILVTPRKPRNLDLLLPNNTHVQLPWRLVTVCNGVGVQRKLGPEDR